jgi:two-component system, LytTR family, response regulator
MAAADKRTYTCIIVDDREIDRLVVQAFLLKYPAMALAGSFASAAAALDHIRSAGAPDAIFLDVDMPGKSGLDLRNELRTIPACIFITAHAEYALEGFELAALDYIVKPLKADRFEKAMRRLEEYLDLHYKAELLEFTLGENTLFIKEGFHQVKLQIQEIVYLEALKDYTGIITKQKKYCVLSPLGSLIKEKAFQSFVRIHRSYAIHRHAVSEISAKGIRVNDILLPVGKSYKESVDKFFSV